MKNISLTERIVFIVVAGLIVSLPTASQSFPQSLPQSLKIAQRPTRLSGVVIKFNTPPADSAVKLLDNILSKVRGLPQIAVYKPTLMALSRDNAQAPAAEEPSITDFRLAIEPRQDSMRAQDKNRIASSVTFELKKDADSVGSLSAASATAAKSQKRAEEWRGKAKNESAQFYRARKEMELDEGAAVKPESWKAGKLDDAIQAPGVQRQILGGSATTVAGNLRSGDKKLSLLPPNVAMGIPLLRLGSAQSQISKNFEALGQVKKETIKGWTIWSFNKGAGESAECRLQVFTRAGTVQAIRVFDPEFASPDLGIQNGDSLTLLKERYGQPAFILSEPANSTCQNYVYPLSQVAFLLSRPAPDREPQVVSQFIFNLK
jgi:hypothetical protein